MTIQVNKDNLDDLRYCIGLTQLHAEQLKADHTVLGEKSLLPEGLTDTEKELMKQIEHHLFMTGRSCGMLMKMLQSVEAALEKADRRIILPGE